MNILHYKPAFVLCIFCVLFAFINAKAQTSDVPRIISYQGQVASVEGKPMNGLHHIVVSLYSDRFGKTSVWQGIYDADVKNGVFSLLLGSGKYKLPQSADLNKLLWVGIKIDDGEEMKPLTQLVSVPYALNVPNKSITAEKLSDEVMLGLYQGSAPKIQTANDTNFYWSEKGNTNVKGPVRFLGSTDSSEVWIKTNNQTAIRYEKATLTGTVPNIVGGYNAGSPSDSNIITDINSPTQAVAVEGSVIAGGGREDSVNIIGASFSFIGAGLRNYILHDNTSNHYGPAVKSGIVAGEGNSIRSPFGFIGGGYGNVIDIASDLNVVVGGKSNQAGDNNPSDSKDSRAFVGGGESNWAREELSSVVGGYSNKTESASTFIGGGEENRISHEDDVDAALSAIVAGKKDSIISRSGFIGGGGQNTIGRHVTDSTNRSDFAVITGGEKNVIFLKANHAVIGGGKSNEIDTSGAYSFLGGGLFNKIQAPLNAICGGDSNFIGRDIWNSSYSFIGAGLLDTIDGGSPYNVICGGWKNHNGGGWSLMGAGARNYIYDNSICDLIGSGRDNFIGNQARTHGGKGISYSSILGGDSNTVAAEWSGILGGKWNLIANKSEYSFLGGGKLNSIDSNSNFSSLGGGLFNRILSPFSVINGGDSNLIDLNVHNSVIGGGHLNSININGVNSTISGGDSNRIQGISGVIGGGTFNTIAADTVDSHTSVNWSTIGGGYHNLITRPPPGLLYPCSPDSVFEPVYVTIAGGAHNVATGHISSIIGGYRNSAYGMGAVALGGWHLEARDWQTVCGRYNRTTLFGFLRNSGPFKEDSTYLPSSYDVTFMVGNGTTDTTRSNAFEVHHDGHADVFKVNGSGDATQLAPHYDAVDVGGIYVESPILAWADVGILGIGATAQDTVYSDFGVKSIIRLHPGVYKIHLNLHNPIAGTEDTLVDAAITATIVYNDTSIGTGAAICGVACVSQINFPKVNEFVVRTYPNGSDSCAAEDRHFMFHVAGRHRRQ